MYVVSAAIDVQVYVIFFFLMVRLLIGYDPHPFSIYLPLSIYLSLSLPPFLPFLSVFED